MQCKRTVGARSCARPGQRSLKTQVSTQVTAPTTTKMSSAFTEELGSKLQMLQKHKAEWASLPLREKVQLLKDVRGRLLNDMYSWGKEGAMLKGQEQDQWAVAESTFINPLIISRYLDSLIGSLEHLEAHGKCVEVPTRTTPTGQVVAQVCPALKAEKENKLQKGVTAELYIQPGKPSTQGSLYLGHKPAEAKVAALLGAGNFGFLGVKDILYQLYERGNVVLFKPHPLQAGWHKFADAVLEPLAKRGFYASIYTDSIAETQQMLYHPDVETMHMTGGTSTHDAIVWGATPEEQAQRKAANDPKLKVPVTSELGCVTPWIVTPGNWTEEQLNLHAMSAVYAVHLNNSCACNALKVLVLPAGWSQADAFLDKMRAYLKNLPLQPPFYPGHNQRYNAWKAVFPQAEEIQAAVQPTSKDFGGAKPMPYLIQEVPYAAPGEPLSKQQEYAFQVEPFAPVLSVVRVPSQDAGDFMAKATALCNTQLWGTLSCTVLLHPDAEASHPKEAQQMLDELQYGAIGVNMYSGGCYSTPHAIWGAYVGNQTLANVGSGIGYVNNTLFFDYPQKAVVKTSFMSTSSPKPLHRMGLPSWAFGPLAGLVVGGWRGLARALFSRR